MKKGKRTAAAKAGEFIGFSEMSLEQQKQDKKFHKK